MNRTEAPEEGVEGMKLTTTFARLRAEHACASGYKTLAEALGGVRAYGEDTPINLLQILESNGVADCLWSLRTAVEECDSCCRLLAADIAEAALHIFETRYPTDLRPRQAIEAARAYARVEIQEAELDRARSAAADAVADAVADAAADAADAADAVADATAVADAAADAVADAVAVADAAAEAAAEAADAADAARSAQAEIIKKYLH